MTARKILIVEDDHTAALSYARMLQPRGYDVVTAPDAITAVSVAISERPDLVLLDLGLPGGGASVLRRLRNLVVTATTPVIVVTGALVDDETRRSLVDAGCDAVLSKPLQPDQLVVAVSAVFDGLGQR